MKKLKLGISALALTIASTVFAQTTKNPWLVGVGANGINHKAVSGSLVDNLTLQNYEELFKANNYSFSPPLSKLTIARNLNKLFVLDWQTTVGNFDNKKYNMGKEFLLSTQLGLQFKLNGLWNEDSWFDPYLRVAPGYLRHDYEGKVNFGAEAKTDEKNHFTATGGIGSNFWFTKSFGLGIQGDYVTTPINKSTVPNFWQASASLLFRFGNTDTDGDGIVDKDDKCPQTPGLAQFDGCPDTDGDGISDNNDDCPDVAGPVANNGCPWPDTDNDGVLDKDDNCVDVAGPVANNGCPWPDTDNDGVLDKDDECPNEPGLVEYKGCPKPDKVVADHVTIALKDVMFNFNKATIRKQSNAKLDLAAKYIKQSKGGKFLLIGHTDKKGSAKYNLKLSQKRAAAVVKALEARGVNPAQLKSKGVGEAEATVSEKASNEARMVDRKVVVKSIGATEWNSLPKRDY